MSILIITEDYFIYKREEPRVHSIYWLVFFFPLISTMTNVDRCLFCCKFEADTMLMNDVFTQESTVWEIECHMELCPGYGVHTASWSWSWCSIYIVKLSSILLYVVP